MNTVETMKLAPVFDLENVEFVYEGENRRMLKKQITAVVAICLLLSATVPASAISAADAKKELNQTQQQLNDVSSQKKAAKQSLLKDKKTRDGIIAKLESKGYEKQKIESSIADIESAIATLESAIELSEQEYDAQLKLFQERLVGMYVYAKSHKVAFEVLDSSSITDLVKNVEFMNVIAKSDQDMMTSLEAKRLEIEQLKQQKQNEEDNAQEELENSLQQISELSVSRSAAEERVSKSQKSVAELEKAENQLEKESQELGELIKKISSKGKYIGGVMKWPTPGYEGISSLFGYRIHPILKYKKFHGGIDINAPANAPIHAAAAGKVISAGWRSGGSGYTIIIDHGGGITTFYLHIKKGGILVKEGQTVDAGDVIAKVGSTGLSTGPHLHFEVRKNGERQDPLNYVTGK